MTPVTILVAHGCPLPTIEAALGLQHCMVQAWVDAAGAQVSSSSSSMCCSLPDICQRDPFERLGISLQNLQRMGTDRLDSADNGGTATRAIAVSPSGYPVRFHFMAFLTT